MLKNFQKSLLISTAIPVAFMAASAAQARDVSVPAPVAPATSVPGTTVNAAIVRSEEHTSELQSLMRISYAVFCLKNKNQSHTTIRQNKRTVPMRYSQNIN